MEVLQIILQQMGGQMFLAMTGGKAYRVNDYTLGVKFQSCQKANYVTIFLNSMDTYDMKFYQCSPTTLVDTEVCTFENLYFDQIQDTFTEVTGLNTSL